MNSTWEKAAEKLEELILDDPANRCVRQFYIPGELARSACALLDSRRILIITGFYILSAGAGESDGPPGAVVLARALSKLGKEVMLVTDTANEDVVRAAVEAVDAGVSVYAFAPEEQEDDYRDFLNNWKPTHIVAVERPGRAEDGQYYSMRAESISHVTARIDWLVLLAGEAGITTIGLGDGGNEIGMGKVRDRVTAWVAHGEQISCVVAADHLVVAGVTNWAAYALVTLMSLAEDKILLHTPVEEKKMLEAMTRSGCVDGNLCKPANSIDGVPLEGHQLRIQEMMQFLK